MSKQNSEQGDVDLVLVLFLVLGFVFKVSDGHLKILLSWKKGAEELSRWEAAPIEEASLPLLGESVESPLPKIDYGAYRQRNRDAEALCIIVRENLSETESKRYTCE